MQSANERFGKQRAGATGRPANVGEQRREKGLGVRDVPVDFDRKAAIDVTRHDEHDERRLTIALAEQHGVRVVRDHDRKVVQRSELSVPVPERQRAPLALRRKTFRVRDHRVARPGEVGVGQVGIGRAERSVAPVVAEEIPHARQAAAPAHHFVRDVFDLRRRDDRGGERGGIQPRRRSAERRHHLRQQRVLRLLGELPVGDFRVVVKGAVGRPLLRPRRVPPLIGEHGADDERQDQQADGPDQSRRAMHAL